MKKAKSLIVTCVCITGFALQSIAQEITLPEITVVARNYKYLKSTNTKQAAQPVNLLQWKAAAYDVKNSDFYEDENDTYYITFYLPEGYVLAVYDQAGKLLRTAERYEDVALPSTVRNAVIKKYPGWVISKDIYLVSYNNESGTNKIYKLVLQNGNKNMRIKATEKGDIL